MNVRHHAYVETCCDIHNEPFLYPRPDETSLGYVARVAAAFPEHPLNEIARLCFDVRTSAFDRPYHFGWGHFSQYLQRHGCDYDCIENFSPLPLFRPFVAPDRFERSVTVALTRQVGSWNPTQQQSSTIFRASPALCPKCVAADCEAFGSSWFRRTHQAVSVTSCPEHGCMLLNSCPSCGSEFPKHAPPAPKCKQCGNTMASTMPTAPAELAVAKIVQAIYAGALPSASLALRLATLRARVAERVQNRSGVVGDNLARRVLQYFGRTYLESLNLAPDKAPCFAWPMLLIHGLHFTDHPTPNILLISMLFDSVEDYADALEEQRARCGTAEPKNNRHLIGVCNITPVMFRAAFRHTIEEAVARTGGNEKRLMDWFSAYPKLSARRKAFHARQQLLRDRRILQRYVAQDPQIKRASLREICERQLCRLRNTDPVWLNQLVPKRPGGRPKKQSALSIPSTP